MVLRCVSGEREWPEPPRLEDDDHLGIAAQARDRMGRPRWVIPPTHYAALHRVPVVHRAPPTGDEITDGERAWLKPQADVRKMGDALYHAMAHVLLVRARVEHTEADVWAVQAELVLPYEVAIRCPTIEHAMRLQPHASKRLLEAVLERARARFLRLGWRL